MNAPALGVTAAVQPSPIASLAMYDTPELHAANDELWAAIASRLEARGIAAPTRLTRDADLEQTLRDPGLVLGQTCGLPLVTTLRDHVQLVATPRYRAPGCLGVFHSSAIVVSAANAARDLTALRGGRCAINSRDSNTGANLLQAEIAPLAGRAPFFGEVQITGSHLASLTAVAAGEADVAAIDSVSLALAKRHDPALASMIRVLRWTQRCPALPLVTALSTPPRTLRALRAALREVSADPALASARNTLMLVDFTAIPRSAYDQIDRIRRGAAALGYSQLA